MGKLTAGDTIIDRYGNMATVRDTMESVSIQWHDGVHIMGCYPAELFELVPRKFREGQYVRIQTDDEYNGLIGFIFEDDGDPEDESPYAVFLYTDEGEEQIFDADEMIPWVPLVGERVIEAGVEGEEDEGGVVLGINLTGTEGGVDDVSVRVLWDSYPHAQNWLVEDLAPEDDYEESDEIAVGDEVEYESPGATVQEVDGNIIRVAFHNGPLADGNYSKELFSKKVA